MARVSCAGTALCVGTDDYDAMAFSAQAAAADVGTRLGITLDPPDVITDVSCASTTFCLATIDGSFAETIIYNGATWRTSGLDQQSGDFVIFECFPARRRPSARPSAPRPTCSTGRSGRIPPITA